MNLFGTRPAYRLFIGGPADGKVVALPDNREVYTVVMPDEGGPVAFDVSFSKPAEHSVMQVRYFSMPLFGDNREEPITVMVRDGMTPSDVMKKLVTSYRPVLALEEL